jgi:monofunctional glycosyltransferase
VSQVSQRSLVGRLWRLLWLTVLWLIGISIVWVLIYRFIDPPVTWLMARDRLAGKAVTRNWVDIETLGKRMPYAAIAAEDGRFCEHWGFDLEAIQKVIESNERNKERGRKRLKGGSTISQQTAKNVFLWPHRSWVRKGAEAWFTLLIEGLWGKRRIMEVYLNVVEWGPGVYGADAAARYHFKRPVTQLSRDQAAFLVSILPSPLKWSPTDPSRRVSRKASNVRKTVRAVSGELGQCLKL